VISIPILVKSPQYDIFITEFDHQMHIRISFVERIQYSNPKNLRFQAHLIIPLRSGERWNADFQYHRCCNVANRKLQRISMYITKKIYDSKPTLLSLCVAVDVGMQIFSMRYRSCSFGAINIRSLFIKPNKGLINIKPITRVS
jgi:hypothetical protein